MMTKVVADVILRLSDSAIVPLDIINFVDLVRKGKQMLTSYKAVFDNAGINLGKKQMLTSYKAVFHNRQKTNAHKLQSSI